MGQHCEKAEPSAYQIRTDIPDIKQLVSPLSESQDAENKQVSHQEEYKIQNDSKVEPILTCLTDTRDSQCLSVNNQVKIYQDLQYRFEGQIQNGLRQGQGTQLFKLSGMRYVGQFRKGKREGFGDLEFPKILRYQGLFFNNKFDGFGKLTWEDQTQYQGEFRNGQPHGFGKFIYKDGRQVQGHFNSGLRHGNSIVRKDKARWQCKFEMGDLIQACSLE